MMKKGTLKRKLALLFTAVLAIGLASYMPNEAIKVQAEDTVAKTNVELGTRKIANPSSSGGGWSHVYFGKYNNSPVKYRVLDNETTVFSKEDEDDIKAKTMLLDCDSVLWAKSQFNSANNNDWATSSTKRFLNSEKDESAKPSYNYSSTGFLTTSFSKAEQDAIAASTKENAYEGDNSDSGKDGDGYQTLEWKPLTGEKIFLLDAKEATNTSYGYSNDNSRKKTGGEWWLRSPKNGSTEYVGSINSYGPICPDYSATHNSPGVSPALNINLSSVLFSSEILGSDNKIEGYKLTLIDKTSEGSKLNIALNENVTRKSNNEVTIPYTLSGDDEGEVNQVSVVITDAKYESGNENGANVLYYSALTLSNGEGTFTLPADSTLNLSDKVCGKDYYAYIVAEIVNGKYETDYASEPCQINIPSKPWVAPTVNTINIGTSAIANPFQPVSEGDRNTAWTGNYVYFGTYNDSPVKYRVLANETDDFGGTTMLLDCDSILMQRKFGSNRYWSQSDIKRFLNGEKDATNNTFDYSSNGFLVTSFSVIEQNAIATSKKETPNSIDGEVNSSFPLEFIKITGEKIFLLDIREAANTSYGYINDTYSAKWSENRVKAVSGGSANSWWLRSYNGYVQYEQVYFISYLGYRDCENCSIERTGVSPAFNIALSSVLFSSASDTNKMNKTSILSADSSKIVEDQVTEWKLTLKDSGKTVSVTDGKNVTKKSDGTITVPYTYTDTATDSDEKVNQISVMITDGPFTGGANILYYGRLDTDLSKGTGTFKLPSDLSGKTLGSGYHLYILAEHVSGEKVTDYASEPVEITSITDVSDTPASADTDDSNNSSSDTDTGNPNVESTDTSSTVKDHTGSAKKSNNKKTGTSESVKEEVKEESLNKDEQETKQDSKETKTDQTEEKPINNILKEASEIPEENKHKLNEAIEEIKNLDANIQTGPYVLSETDEISFDIPDELKSDDRTYYLVTVDEGENVVILQNESTDEGKFEAEGKADTVYQLIFEDGETPLAAMISNDGILETHESGKLIWPWIVLGVLVVGGFIFFIIYKKRKDDEEQPSA